MNKLSKQFFILLIPLILSACSSDSSDSAPPVKVNLLGTWNYQSKFQNTNCDALFPKGTITIESLNGDLTKVGNFLIQGQGIDTDSFGNCFFTVINSLDPTWSGRPAEQTVGEYSAFIVADRLGDNTIVSNVIEIFTETKIQETKKTTDGAIVIFVMTR